MLGHGIREITRMEPQLFEAIPTAVTPVIAAALTMGFMLLPEQNHQDVITGCQHLQDYRKAPRSKLTRYVTFRFRAHVRALPLLGGEKLHVEQFVARYEAEPALRKAVVAHPRYEAWHNRLRTLLLSATRCLMATQGDRVAIIPIHGDPQAQAAFARFFEEGW